MHVFSGVVILVGLFIIVFADRLRKSDLNNERRYRSNRPFHEERMTQYSSRYSTWFIRFFGALLLLSGIWDWVRH